ncbi:MAG: response regulator transcription factor [Bacteroidota bacterium]
MKDTTIAIIDDQEDILELLEYNLTKERAQVRTFTSGYEGLAFISESLPDAIICDWMLEDIDGIEICREVKRQEQLEHIPFIMLTARSDEIDAVIALEVGADDYIAKPVRIKELISRIKRSLKQRQSIPESKVSSSSAPLQPTPSTEEEGEPSPPKLCFKKLTVDVEKYKAHLDDIELNLTYTEFKLLQLFVAKPGRVYSRHQIIEKLNGLDYIVTERSIDVQIVGLRKKLGKYKDYLETVRGVGYRLSDD